MQKMLPQAISVNFLPKVHEFLDLNKQQPQAVKTIIMQALETGALPKDTLANLANGNPQLGKLAKELGLM